MPFRGVTDQQNPIIIKYHIGKPDALYFSYWTKCQRFLTFLWFTHWTEKAALTILDIYQYAGNKGR